MNDGDRPLATIGLCASSPNNTQSGAVARPQHMAPPRNSTCTHSTHHSLPPGVLSNVCTATQPMFHTSCQQVALPATHPCRAVGIAIQPCFTLPASKWPCPPHIPVVPLASPLNRAHASGHAALLAMSCDIRSESPSDAGCPHTRAPHTCSAMWRSVRLWYGRRVHCVQCGTAWHCHAVGYGTLPGCLVKAANLFCPEQHRVVAQCCVPKARRPPCMADWRMHPRSHRAHLLIMASTTTWIGFWSVRRCTISRACFTMRTYAAGG